jgi:hypothetical protein
MPGSRSLLVTSQKESAEFDRLKVQNLKVTNTLNTDNVISDQVFVFENFYLYNATLNVDSNTITANKNDILATVWSDRPYKIKINLSDDDAVELLRASFDESLGNYSYKNNNPNMVVMINNTVVILTLKDYSVMGDEVTFFYENNFNSQIVDNYTGKISMFIDTLPAENVVSPSFINSLLGIQQLITFTETQYRIRNPNIFRYLAKGENEYTYRIDITFAEPDRTRDSVNIQLSLGSVILETIERRDDVENFWQKFFRGNSSSRLYLYQIRNIITNLTQLFSLRLDNFGILNNQKPPLGLVIRNLSGPTNKLTYKSNGRRGDLFIIFGQGNEEFNAIFQTEYSRIRIDRVNNTLSIIQINLDGTNLVINNIEQLNNYGSVSYKNDDLNINENSVLTIITNGPINNL